MPSAAPSAVRSACHDIVTPPSILNIAQTDEWLMLAHPRWAVFWLFAIGELVGYKPCAILATSWWVSGDHGQCRDTPTRQTALTLLRAIVTERYR
jgi:hypothetical protein